MRNTVKCQRNSAIQKAVSDVNLENVMRNTVISHRNLGIQNVVCHRNLERCNTKYGNVSEEFRYTQCNLSQEFKEM
jgi:hypothetical protein